MSALAKLSTFVLVVASGAACGGEPFQAGSGGSANRSEAGASAITGGSFNTGSGGSVGSSGGQGGSSNGAGGAGSTASSGGNSSAFPATALLDDFDREDGAPGRSWIGASEHFEVDEQTLIDKGSAGAPLVWSETFGVDQEVFATLYDFDDDQAEINLLLKVQNAYAGCNLMEVLYEPVQGEVEVQFCSGNDWTYAGSADLELEPGDELGARTYANGQTKVYVNGEVVLTVDASAFQYHAVGGHIGVNSIGKSIYDDFGGGDIAP